jgi:hypothetical protein
MSKDEKENPEKTITSPELNKATLTKPTKNSKKHKTDKINKPLVIILFVLIFLVIIFATGGALRSLQSNSQPERQNNMMSNYQRRQPRMHSAFFQTGSSDINTNYNISSGVVTSVGENSFVIAGNGTTITVNTTGDTTYNTANKKVSVNDSVLVVGTKADSKITATSVRIVNL